MFDYHVKLFKWHLMSIFTIYLFVNIKKFDKIDYYYY